MKRVYEVRTYEASPGIAEFADVMVFYPLTLSFDRPNGAIAFSPGFRAAADNYEWWGPTLASLGYNVFIFNTNEPTDSLAARADALTALVDFIKAENASPDSPVANKIDEEKIVLMGHSMGGGAALAAADALGDAIAAVIPLQLYCCEPGSTFEGDYSSITAPTLVIASAEDDVAPPEAHARLLYDSLGSDNKIYMEFAAGNHMIVANGGPEHDTMGRLTLAFLKAYLDGVDGLVETVTNPGRRLRGNVLDLSCALRSVCTVIPRVAAESPQYSGDSATTLRFAQNDGGDGSSDSQRLGDCLIGELSRQRPHIGQTLAPLLDHTHHDQVFYRIEPEPGAGCAAPVVFSHRVGFCFHRIGNHREIKAKYGPRRAEDVVR